jgi:hypothetical protein
LCSIVKNYEQRDKTNRDGNAKTTRENDLNSAQVILTEKKFEIKFELSAVLIFRRAFLGFGDSHFFSFLRPLAD